MARVHAAQADIFLRLKSGNLDECFALLLSRQADVALVYRVENVGQPISADYIETVKIGDDRLIPVFAAEKVAAFRGDFAEGMLRVIAYPPDVFFGEAIARCIYPAITSGRIVPVAETALTLAAQELALAGLGVAWLPQSLVSRMVTDGRLADLSEWLPTLGLDVTAVRLVTQRQPVQDAVWDVLTRM